MWGVGVGRAEESIVGKMRTTVLEQNFFKKGKNYITLVSESTTEIRLTFLAHYVWFLTVFVCVQFVLSGKAIIKKLIIDAMTTLPSYSALLYYI